jgi:DNA-binding GntR family transcriptional regulator
MKKSKAQPTGKKARGNSSPAGKSASAADNNGRKTSQTENAVDLIRSKIIDLSLAPGTKLDEPLLVQEFRLGRTPAREAINRLVAEGLASIFPNRGGTFVRGLDLPEIGEVLMAYQLVETVLAQLCRFDDPGLVSDLENIQARYVKEVHAKSFLGITSVNEEFHLRMHRSIGNGFFYEFALSTHRHVRRLLVLLYKMEMTEKNLLETQLKINLGEHEGIIDAIRRSDRAGLNRVLPEHSRQAQTRLQKVMDKKLPALSLEQLAAMYPGSLAT